MPPKKKVHPPLTPDDPRHGTPHCYCHLGCRCVRCRHGWLLYGRRLRASRPLCTIEGCTNHQHARQLCSGHYARLKRGQPLNDRPLKPPGGRRREVL